MKELDCLTEKERNFVNNLCQGLSGVEAYLDAFDSKNRAIATRKASVLKQKPKIAAAIQAVEEFLDMSGVATKREICMYLTRAINDPASVIDKHSPLAQDIISEEIDDTGREVVKIKTVDKLKAADMLAKMRGFYEPEKINVDTTGLKDLITMVRKS